MQSVTEQVIQMSRAWDLVLYASRCEEAPC